LLENPNKKSIVEEVRKLILKINSIENSKSNELNQKLEFYKIIKRINEEVFPEKPINKYLDKRHETKC